jgi:NAD(P)-dependent dehydrogenase (short-subunit alcohol dehydrogenase family)
MPTAGPTWAALPGSWPRQTARFPPPPQRNRHSEHRQQRIARKAWIITGPTSGIGRRTALKLAKHGTVVLVGRNPSKPDEVDEVDAEIRKQEGAEDPESKPAVTAGFRGGRYISAEARDPAFANRIVADTRALLATTPSTAP